jgi:hypothetical protein
MRKYCIVIFIVFFNVFAVRAHELSSYIPPPDPSPPPKMEKIDMPPDYTLEIFMAGAVITIVYLCWISRKEKPFESQTQEKSFSRNVNFVPCVQFNISSQAAQRRKHVTSTFKAGIRF